MCRELHLNRLRMKIISLSEMSDFLELSTIESTSNLGWAVIHTGKDENGREYVLTNDCYGNAGLTIQN